MCLVLDVSHSHCSLMECPKTKVIDVICSLSKCEKSVQHLIWNLMNIRTGLAILPKTDIKIHWVLCGEKWRLFIALLLSILSEVHRVQETSLVQETLSFCFMLLLQRQNEIDNKEY